MCMFFKVKCTFVNMQPEKEISIVFTQSQRVDNMLSKVTENRYIDKR